MTKAQKEYQNRTNAQIDTAIEAINAELAQAGFLTGHRLRSCSATVYSTGNYYVLRSYNTIIAAIDKRTDTCFDFLRKVYGYTATSAQHISKFDHDYGTGAWGCRERMTWRYV